MFVFTWAASWFFASMSALPRAMFCFTLTPLPVPRKKRLLLSYLLPVKGIFTFAPAGLLLLQAGSEKASMVSRGSRVKK